MEKKKKILIGVGIGEAALLIFALVVSIIVWSTAHTLEQALAAGYSDLKAYNIKTNGAFIAFFQNTPVAFFLIICLPIFILIAVDFVYLAITAYKRETNLTDDQMKAIKKKAEAQVREEVMQELLAQDENKKEEKE